MPYVSIRSGAKLDETKRALVRKAVFDAIVLIPGKTPEVTMVEISDGCDLQKGPVTAPALFAELRLFTKAPMEAKRACAKQLMESLAPVTGIPTDRMYLNYLEFFEWGSGGHYNGY